MQKLTKEQAIIISAYTGFTACNFGDLHEAVEFLDRMLNSIGESL